METMMYDTSTTFAAMIAVIAANVVLPEHTMSALVDKTPDAREHVDAPFQRCSLERK